MAKGVAGVVPVTDRERVELDSATHLPPLHAITHDVHVLLETLGYLGIVLIDLEPFGSVEMEFGRSAYNELLGKVAREAGALRSEVLGSGDLLCTVMPYGEQIAFFLEGPRRGGDFSHRELEQVAARIHVAFMARLAAVLSPFGITAAPRVGFALVLSNAMVQPERLVYRGLDEARRIAASQELHVAARARERLRDILINEQLRMFFQPVIDLHDGGVHGYEALVRGPTDAGFEMPAALFHLASTAKLSGEMLRACFRCAMESATDLPAGADLFLNVTPGLVNDPRFREALLESEEGAIPPSRIVIELSESVAVRNYELLERGLSDLRNAGARLAIDDVGAGYANLTHVVRLQPDYLKLDMSLVRDVHIERAKRALVRSLLVASEDIGAKVVAEGIEKDEERATVVELGVRLAQGFLWGRPGPGFAVPRLSP